MKSFIKSNITRGSHIGHKNIIPSLHNVNLTYSNALYIHLNRLLAKSLWSGDKKAHSLSTKLIALIITDLHSSLVIILFLLNLMIHKAYLYHTCGVPAGNSK